MPRSAPRRSGLAVVPLLAFLVAGCDIALADFKDAQTAEWRRSYELRDGGRVEIGNVNGRIEVQPSAGRTVDVLAVRTARAASQELARQALERIEIRDTSDGGSVKIETRIDRSQSRHDRANGLDVRYTVRVPAGADVKFTTVNGGVEVSGLRGRMDLQATNGGVKAIDVAGELEARTTNGGVEVALAAMPERGVKLGCTNGGITLRLPASSRATISARITNGGIETRGLTLDALEKSRRRLEARLNGGGPRIELDGTNGGVRLIGR